MHQPEIEKKLLGLSIFCYIFIDYLLPYYSLVLFVTFKQEYCLPVFTEAFVDDIVTDFEGVEAVTDEKE